MKFLLVVYGDDFKFVGSIENMSKGWSMFRTNLRIDPKTDLGLHLGCMLTRGDSKPHDGLMINTISYNMEGLPKLSVEIYLEIIGHEAKIKNINIPNLPKEIK